MPVYEERQAQKRRWQRYREAAARLFPSATISAHGAVSETADKNGAFLEVTVWVPRSEIEEK